jgi:hypothetical protein
VKLALCGNIAADDKDNHAESARVTSLTCVVLKFTDQCLHATDSVYSPLSSNKINAESCLICDHFHLTVNLPSVQGNLVPETNLRCAALSVTTSTSQ